MPPPETEASLIHQCASPDPLRSERALRKRDRTSANAIGIARLFEKRTAHGCLLQKRKLRLSTNAPALIRSDRNARFENAIGRPPMRLASLDCLKSGPLTDASSRNGSFAYPPMRQP